MYNYIIIDVVLSCMLMCVHISIQKLGQSNLQPSALLKIVSCLLMLVQDWRALDVCDDVDTVCTDITTLLGM